MTDGSHPDDIGLPSGPLSFVSADQLEDVRAERDRLRACIDTACNALSREGATNWERVQAAGLILACSRLPATNRA